MFEQGQQQEMQSDEYAHHTAMLRQDEEERYSSIRYCSKCKRNWSKLPVQDEEGDEQYECCPICRTDTYLTDYSGGDTYIFCQITGEIINDRTGKGETLSAGLAPEVDKPRNPFDAEKYEAKKEYNESLEDRALAAYYKVFEIGGHAAAEKAYRQVLTPGSL